MLVGVQSHTAAVKISVVVPWKDGNLSSSRFRGPHLGVYPKDASPYFEDTFSTTFSAAVFIIETGNNLDVHQPMNRK